MQRARTYLYQMGCHSVQWPGACLKGCEAEAHCVCRAVVQHRRHPEGKSYPVCARALDGLLPAEGRGPWLCALKGLHAAAKRTV